MSCGELPSRPILRSEQSIASRETGSENHHRMKGIANSARVAGLVLVVGSFVSAVSQNGKGQGLGEQMSQSGQSEAGLETARAAAIGQADGTGNPALGGRRPLYRLNRSDVVMLSFTLSPEFDQTLTVQPDGYIRLKDAGSVFAQGLTLEELQQAVDKAYTGYLHDPQAAVALKEFEHPYFIAGGEVGRPGKYELRADLTVIEAIEIAGGFTHQAKHSQVLLFRRVNDGLFEAHVFDLKSMLKKKNLGEITDLRPGDLIFIPQNTVSKIQPFLTRPALDMYVSPTQF